MNELDLTGQHISITYPRLIQTDGGFYYDGLGNTVSIGSGIGPQGFQGPRGDLGMYGPQGVDGPQGPRGDLGMYGPQGFQGAQGSPGPGRYFTQMPPSPPLPLDSGDRWYDLSTGIEYVWIDDGNTSQWVSPGTSQAGTQGAIESSTIFNEGSSIPSSTNIDNYTLNTGTFFKIEGSSSSIISGFTGGTPGRYIIIVNNTDKDQTFSQEDLASDASNRFMLGSANKIIGTNQTATFIYVSGLTISGISSQSRWLLTAAM